MQCTHFAFGALALAFGSNCGSQGSVDADAAGKTATKAEVAADADVDARVDAIVDANLKPRIGGTIIVTGGYNVEILAFVDGRIEAVIMDAKGMLVAASGELRLAATLAAKGDAKAKVDLAWDSALARFVGRVEGGIELVRGPVEVELTIDGKASIGTLAELGLAVQASHGGQIMVAGAFSVEVAAQAGFVHAFVFDGAGRVHAAGDLDIDLDIDAAGKLELKWDPPSASYKAELAGGLDLEAKPLVVWVAADGKLAIAAVQSFHASAKVAVAGDLDADARVAAKADASGRAGASVKSNAKVQTKKKASASGKASVKTDGGIKASGSAKAKAGFKFGS